VGDGGPSIDGPVCKLYLTVAIISSRCHDNMQRESGRMSLAPPSPVTVATPDVALPTSTFYPDSVKNLFRRYGEFVVNFSRDD
jgi:hypothetical protein